MIPPGGDELIRAAADMIVQRLEIAEARHVPGYAPRRFENLPAPEQAFWLTAMRGVVEMTIAATLSDMAHAVGSYDGCQGAAYERTVHRYALTELDFQLHGE